MGRPYPTWTPAACGGAFRFLLYGLIVVMLVFMPMSVSILLTISLGGIPVRLELSMI